MAALCGRAQWSCSEGEDAAEADSSWVVVYHHQHSG